METQQSKGKIAINFGLILGFLTIIVSLIKYVSGSIYEQEYISSIVLFAATVFLIVFGIRKHKEANDGYLTLGEGLKTGMSIALIGAIIGVLYTVLFMTVIEPDFMKNTLEIAREKMLNNSDISEEQVEAAIEMQKKFTSPGIVAAFSLLWSLFVGFVISLITSAAVQRKQTY